MAHPLLVLKPDNVLVFTQEADTGDGLEAHIQIQNVTNSPVAFKVQTTNPKRYACKPCMGIIAQQSTSKIGVKLSYVEDPADLSRKILPEPEENIRDKFQILSTPFVASSDRGPPNQAELNQLLAKDRESVLGQRLLTQVRLHRGPENNNTLKLPNNGHINRAESASKSSNYVDEDETSDLDPDQAADRPDTESKTDEVTRLRAEVARVNRLYRESLEQQRNLSRVINFILFVMVLLFAVLMYGTLVLNPGLGSAPEESATAGSPPPSITT